MNGKPFRLVLTVKTRLFLSPPPPHRVMEIARVTPPALQMNTVTAGGRQMERQASIIV